MNRPLEHLASDPDTMRVLINLYLAGYAGGAFTALWNVPAGALSPEPRSNERAGVAHALSAELIETMQGDPAVGLTLEQGITALLRGEDPSPDVLRPAGR